MVTDLPAGWELAETCAACPEQYDLFDEQGRIVAYMRLRSGYFRVRYGGASGPTIYEHEWLREGLKGMFESSEERDEHLTAAVAAAVESHARRGPR